MGLRNLLHQGEFRGVVGVAFDIGAIGGADEFAGVVAGYSSAGAAHLMFNLLQDGSEEIFAVLEVCIQRSRCASGLFSNIEELCRGVAVADKNLPGSGEDFLAPGGGFGGKLLSFLELLLGWMCGHRLDPKAP